LLWIILRVQPDTTTTLAEVRGWKPRLLAAKMAAATVVARFQRASDGGILPPVRVAVSSSVPVLLLARSACTPRSSRPMDKLKLELQRAPPLDTSTDIA